MPAEDDRERAQPNYVASQDGQVAFEQCNPGAVSDQQWWLGRLVRVDDQASTSYSVYDGRGRTECVAARIARPYDVNNQTPVPAFTQRYTPRWYGMGYDYDAADRVTSESTGARLLVGNGGQSRVETHYTGRGVVGSITSSHDMGGTDALVGRIDRTADNLVTLIEYGDLARTATTYTYDDRRRIHSVLTARAPPPGGWPAEPSGDGTFQMVLQDEQYFYDIVNNPVEIRDHRIEEEWPAGAKPVTKKIQYDDLYRAKRIDYQYTAGDDNWTSPHEADIGGAEDTRRATPSPHVSFAKRILWQAYQYDWLGNNVKTSDDADGFYDRSLGDIDNGTTNDGPYQLRGAASTSGASDSDADNQTGSLSASYDVTGNLETLFVQRNGACLGASTCSQSFVYQWDELGRLNAAKRWDGSTQVTDFNAPGAAADLKYVYAAGDQRVIKTATDGSGNSVHTVYVYPSLELRRAEYDGDDPGDYTLDARTEVAYLFANGVRLGRVVNDPLQSDPNPDGIGDLHVFFELGDHLGSTSVALDKETSELVERGTYQAYGGAESDYRPGKWGDFREDYRFTGKEEDVEVGLVYFGKRFYNPLLQRWVSADPLEVHQAASGEPNVYAYVSGSPLANVDPLGLAEDEGAGMSFVAPGVDPDDEAGQSMNMQAPEGTEAEPAPMSVPAPTHAEPQEETIALPEASGRKDCHGSCELNPPSAEAGDAFKHFAVGVAGVAAGVGCKAHPVCLAAGAGMLLGEVASSPDAPAEAKGTSEGVAFWSGFVDGASIGPGRTRTGPAVPSKTTTAVDPELVAQIEAALGEANNAHTTLYHGGQLRGGRVEAGQFSTTPDRGYAELWASENAGQVHRFDVPNRTLREIEMEHGLQRLNDTKAGTSASGEELRFKGEHSEKLNQFRRE